MRKMIIRILICFWAIPLVSSPLQLGSSDISHVMDRLFSLHVENKELNTTVVRRCFKLYIEQFDTDKSYLLSDEIAPYVSMSDDQAESILQRMKANDYSDFSALNRLIQHAIFRAEQNRTQMDGETLSAFDAKGPELTIQSEYAQSKEELIERQKNRMARFYLFHRSRCDLSSSKRKEKLLFLYDKKIRRLENGYLYLKDDGSKMESERAEHAFVVHVLKAFAKSLDTHSSFFSPEEAQEMRLSLEKQFEGVGVVLFEGVDGVMISDLVKGSPAEESGQIKVNDLLVEINGVKLDSVAFEDVLDLLKKGNRNEVVLGLRRMGAQGRSSIFRVPLSKRPIVMNDSRIQTSWEKWNDGGIGKISLYSFYESGDGMSSEKDIKEAIRAFQKKGPLYGLVLDLRDNSGGFLSQAIKVAGLFLSNGVVAISKYARGEVHYLRNLVGHRFYGGPLIILTSKMSASASEIVAQALQDYGVGIVVGDERTFGKGSIQYQTVTDESADLFFKVTVGRYYTASGRTTQIEGVKADIVVPTQYAPFRIGERYLEYPLVADEVKPAFIDPLSDVDLKARWILENRYLPYLQRVVSFWKRILPTLQKNSAVRLSQNAGFQKMIRDQARMQSRLEALPPNSIDEMPTFSTDLPMMEAVNILQDMIQIEEASRLQPEKEGLSLTGTDR